MITIKKLNDPIVDGYEKKFDIFFSKGMTYLRFGKKRFIIYGGIPGIYRRKR